MSRSILKGHRVGLCCRRVLTRADHVKVLKSKDRDAYHYGNLMVCGRVWVCPVCAAKITEKRRAKLVQGVTRWKDQGGGVLLLTLTVPHYAHDSLELVLDGISDARGRMLNRKPWKRLKATLGIEGDVRTLEVTYGANGWHPHFHVLLFTRHPFTPESLPVMEIMILQQWQSACEAAGLGIPNSHGVRVEDGSKAASYASKWGLECEMTKGHIKGSRSGYAPFDLLRVNLGTYAGDAIPITAKKAAALFREYDKAFQGKRQLVWSEGLLKRLDLGKEETDEELATQEEEHARVFAEIPLNVWRVILQGDKRGQLLEVCREGVDAFWIWLSDICEEAGLIGDS